MPCGSGGSKNGLAEAAGAWPSSRVRDQKLHAAAARSTFRSQIVKKKSLILGARLEVELGREAHFEVEMLKPCTRLWHEAHLKIKMLQTSRQAHFEVDV